MRRILPVYGLLAIFFAAERLLRQGGQAASLHSEETDLGSTRAIGEAFGISLLSVLAAPILRWRRIGVLPGQRALFGTGVAAMAAGLIVRSWATYVLGASYTRTLRVTPEQRIVQEGPYRLVRHPGYLGTLLVWLGAAAALANWIVMAVVSAAMLRAYLRRMGAEERMLTDTFGAEYKEYMSRTRRLVPFLY